MFICEDNFAKPLTRRINTIIAIILAFPMIALPLSSREDFTKNNIIKAIVIGTPYVLSLIHI